MMEKTTNWLAIAGTALGLLFTYFETQSNFEDARYDAQEIRKESKDIASRVGRIEGEVGSLDIAAITQRLNHLEQELLDAKEQNLDLRKELNRGSNPLAIR